LAWSLQVLGSDPCSMPLKAYLRIMQVQQGCRPHRQYSRWPSLPKSCLPCFILYSENYVSSHNAGSTRLQTSPPVQQTVDNAKILPAIASFCTVRTTSLSMAQVLQGRRPHRQYSRRSTMPKSCLPCFILYSENYESLHNAGSTRLQTSSLAWQTGATTLTSQMALLASMRGCATAPLAS